ncbi:hypothetical protein [Siminovitchia terrae]|nr:hypothetical protein [Siminovitchia terrae]
MNFIKLDTPIPGPSSQAAGGCSEWHLYEYTDWNVGGIRRSRH